MTRTKTSPPRLLRVGLVLGDQLLDERQIPRGAEVTIGQSLDCTLAVPLEALPRRWVLFDREGGLRLAPTMRAKIEGEGDDTRGRITIGEVTVLFQHVDAHEELRLALPAALRPSLLQRVDRRLAAFVAASILLHAGIATAAWMHDGAHPRPRAPQAISMVEPSMVDLITSLPFDPADPTMTPPEAPPGPAAAIPPPTTTLPKVTTSLPRHGDGQRPHLPELSPEEYIKAMQGGGPSDLPALPALTHTGPGDTTIGGDPDRGPRTQDPIGPSGPTGPGPSDLPGVTDPHKGPEHVPVTDPPKDPIVDPAPDRDWIAEVVRRIETKYMTGLQRCQKKLLATDPLATSMAVKLSFTVARDGSVSAHTARSDAATVSACISGQMDGWLLPTPPAGKDSHVAVKLVLQGS